MSTTKKRFFSALVMIGILSLLMFLGKAPFVLLTYLIGMLICDEVIHNFFKVDRGDIEYLGALIVYFSLAFITYTFRDTYLREFLVFLNVCLVAGHLLLLFDVVQIPKKVLVKLKEYIFLAPLVFFPAISSLASIIYSEQWRYKILGLILLVAITDSSAWFFGRKYGKTPLFPSVSPNKTREGALWGVGCGTVLTYFYSSYFLDQKGLFYLFFLLFLVVMAVLGDLAQSKLKRIFDIKDSSQLIPGHGGIYDRADSILFVSPFYYLFCFF